MIHTYSSLAFKLWKEHRLCHFSETPDKQEPPAKEETDTTTESNDNGEQSPEAPKDDAALRIDTAATALEKSKKDQVDTIVQKLNAANPKGKEQKKEGEEKQEEPAAARPELTAYVDELAKVESALTANGKDKPDVKALNDAFAKLTPEEQKAALESDAILTKIDEKLYNEQKSELIVNDKGTFEIRSIPESELKMRDWQDKLDNAEDLVTKIICLFHILKLQLGDIGGGPTTAPQSPDAKKEGDAAKEAKDVAAEGQIERKKEEMRSFNDIKRDVERALSDAEKEVPIAEENLKKAEGALKVEEELRDTLAGKGGTPDQLRPIIEKIAALKDTATKAKEALAKAQETLRKAKKTVANLDDYKKAHEEHAEITNQGLKKIEETLQKMREKVAENNPAQPDFEQFISQFSALRVKADPEVNGFGITIDAAELENFSETARQKFGINVTGYSLWDASCYKVDDTAAFLAQFNAPENLNKIQETLNAALIQEGDLEFRGQKYAQAVEKYKEALTKNETGDIHMRMGFALIAIGQYDNAVAEMQKGFQLQPDWPARSFHLQEVYADPITKGAHRDALERAVLDRPADPKIAFLAGLFAWSERNMAHAKDLLQTAKKLESGDTSHIDALLSAIG